MMEVERYRTLSDGRLVDRQRWNGRSGEHAQMVKDEQTRETEHLQPANIGPGGGVRRENNQSSQSMKKHLIIVSGLYIFSHRCEQNTVSRHGSRRLLSLSICYTTEINIYITNDCWCYSIRTYTTRTHQHTTLNREFQEEIFGERFEWVRPRRSPIIYDNFYSRIKINK